MLGIATFDGCVLPSVAFFRLGCAMLPSIFSLTTIPLKSYRATARSVFSLVPSQIRRMNCFFSKLSTYLCTVRRDTPMRLASVDVCGNGVSLAFHQDISKFSKTTTSPPSIPNSCWWRSNADGITTKPSFKADPHLSCSGLLVVGSVSSFITNYFRKSILEVSSLKNNNAIVNIIMVSPVSPFRRDCCAIDTKHWLYCMFPTAIFLLPADVFSS
jgi:hypothetical protein